MAFIMVKPPDAGGKKKKETVKQQQTEKARQAEMKATKTLPWKPVEEKVQLLPLRNGKDKGLTLLDRDAGQDPLYNWINDPSYREDYEAQYRKTFQTAFQNSPYTGQKASPFARSGYDRMNDNEIAIYNYYYAKGGKEAAERYLYNLQETLNGRVAQDLYGTVAGDTGLEMLFGAAAEIDRFESDLRSAFNFKDDYIAKTPHQIASAKVRADLADTGFKLPDWLGGRSAGQLAYDAIGAAANMAPSILVSYATGVPMAGNALSGVSSAGNAYAQALNEGFDKDQARGYGLLVGTSEVVLNKLLGGISAYGGNKLGKKAVQNLSNVDDALKMLAKILGGGLSEIPEGHLQAALETHLRNIVLKTDEKVDHFSPEMLYSDLLSALTGIGVESVDAVVNGLPVDFEDIDFTTKDSDYAEFADIFEDLEGWEHLKSLPKAEQEAFIESLTVDALEEGKPATALEDAEFADILSEPEDLENFKYLASLPKAEQEAFIDSLFEEDSVDALEEDNPDGMDEWLFAGTKERDSFSADARDELTEIVRNGTIKLQRGFMCFPENDPLIANSKHVIPKEGFYDVAMHGSPTAVGFGTRKVNMSPRLLANIIRHREDYHGEHIRLLSCSTGLVEGDNYCFAEELANALGVIVEAPNKPIYTYPNGKIEVGKFGEGRMIPYKPNERGRIAARKEDKK